MSYYVEPDYWVAGYADGDYVPGTVLVAGVCNATASVKAAGNRTAGGGGLVIATGTVLAGGNFTQTFPGINLNGKSNTLAAAAITSNSNGALVEAHSESRMTGRPFWEVTAPASGTWIKVNPQAEGFGP